MTNIAIILGSTRPGRIGEPVARWVYENATRRDDASFELVDLLDYKLPQLDEPVPASRGQYVNDHTKAWAATVARFDGFVFVTAEYNHGIPGALKTALDFLYAEWNNKAAGFVSYGADGGCRSGEQLRQVAAELQMATVRATAGFSLYNDYEDFTVLKPKPRHDQRLTMLLDQVISWSNALASIRR